MIQNETLEIAKSDGSRTQTARRSAERRRCDDEKSEKTQKIFQKANNFATAKNCEIFEKFFVFSLIFHRHIFAAQRSPVAKNAGSLIGCKRFFEKDKLTFVASWVKNVF